MNIYVCDDFRSDFAKAVNRRVSAASRLPIFIFRGFTWSIQNGFGDLWNGRYVSIRKCNHNENRH